jgi:ParB-like chromosome segregation protein Spo0J
MTDELRIEYVSLSELVERKHSRNPKDHDIGAISRSVNRFGFTAPVILDERTGYLAAGHGRIDTLAQLKAQGKQPPANVKTDKAGEWLVPVVRGHGFNSDEEVEAYLVADNRLTSLGGWNEPELVALLQDLAAEDEALLEVTGYDGDDLEQLLFELNPHFEPVGIEDQPRLDQKKPITCPHCGQEFVPDE